MVSRKLLPIDSQISEVVLDFGTKSVMCCVLVEFFFFF